VNCVIILTCVKFLAFNEESMKKIAVCYKWVLCDSDIRVNEQTRKLDMEKCKPQINEYDRNGLEAGVQLKAATGAELVGVTCGTATEASTKDALSRGPDAVYYLADPALAAADSTVTSKVLAAMVKKIGDVDVVICSEGSSDEYAQQTGPRLAALLGYASVSYAAKVTANGDTLEIERKMEEGLECVSVPTPVVISIVPEIGEAPIPSVKQILGAKKKPANALALADIGADAKPLINIASVLAPQTTRKSIRLNPEGVSIDEAAAKLVKQLATDGVL
jgi:electron transfer flavoprotein beta subunit